MLGRNKYTIYLISIIVSTFIVVYLGLSISKGFSVEGAIYINSDGVPKIVLNGTLDSNIEEVPLPSKPMPASVTLYVDGELKPPIVVNNSAIISGDPKSKFSITYIPETIIEGGIISFTYSSDFESHIYVDRNIVLLSLPANILDSRYVDNTLVIKFMGDYDVRYVVKEGATTPPPKVGGIDFTSLLPILIVALVGGGLVSFLIFKRRRRSEVDEVIEEFIDETDKLILDTLKDMGGELYQSEIMKKIGIPKTTLWRHLRRLEVLGYVEIKREYKKNRVILKRHYSS